MVLIFLTKYTNGDILTHCLEIAVSLNSTPLKLKIDVTNLLELRTIEFEICSSFLYELNNLIKKSQDSRKMELLRFQTKNSLFLEIWVDGNSLRIDQIDEDDDELVTYKQKVPFKINELYAAFSGASYSQFDFKTGSVCFDAATKTLQPCHLN